MGIPGETCIGKFNLCHLLRGKWKFPEKHVLVSLGLYHLLRGTLESEEKYV